MRKEDLKAGRALLVDLEKAVGERLDDANALFEAGRYASTIAMAFYALEIQLKVVICRRMDLKMLPRAFEIHDPEALMMLTGLSKKIGQVKRPRAVANHWNELTTVAKESVFESIRYIPTPALWDEEKARKVLLQVQDPSTGVIPWLSRQM